jgi:A/G-specific adenine glycosylase
MGNKRVKRPSKKLGIAGVAESESWFSDYSPQKFRQRILRWFERNKRDLPWRLNRDPYAIWVSEIMLQQTQVTTVIDYFIRFMARFPTAASLAAADEQTVLKFWEGLGYYRRARQLHQAAKMIVNECGGRFPIKFDEVLRLPGIGRYTAGAITSIAYDQPSPILEGNTIRLFARLVGLADDIRKPATQKVLWTFSTRIVSGKRAGDFNQALMEIGSQVCRVKQPDCLRCPVASFCRAFATGQQNELPKSSPKLEYESIREAAIVVVRRRATLLRVCQDEERWAGLWDFPRYPQPKLNSLFQLGKTFERDYGFQLRLRDSGISFRHAVTKYRIELNCLVGQIEGGRMRRSDRFRWVPINELGELPLSTTGRKIANRIHEFS